MLHQHEKRKRSEEILKTHFLPSTCGQNAIRFRWKISMSDHPTKLLRDFKGWPRGWHRSNEATILSKMHFKTYITSNKLKRNSISKIPLRVVLMGRHRCKNNRSLDRVDLNWFSLVMTDLKGNQAMFNLMTIKKRKND